MSTPIERVRAALERALKTSDRDSPINGLPTRINIESALSELSCMVLVPVEPTDEFLGECNLEAEGREQWASMIAPYVKGAEDEQ